MKTTSLSQKIIRKRSPLTGGRIRLTLAIMTLAGCLVAMMKTPATAAAAASNNDPLSEEVASLVFGEKFTPNGVSATTGIVSDNLTDLSNNLGFSSQFRPATFSGGTQTPGQMVRGLNFSTLVGSNMALKMNVVEGSLVPFSSHGPIASFTATDPKGFGFSDDVSFGSDFAASHRSLAGLSFLHSLSSTKPTGPESATFFDASRSLQSQDFTLTGSKFSAGFSRLNISNVNSPALLQDVTDTINKNFAGRAALRPVNKPLLNLNDVKALDGVQQRDGYLMFKPGGSLALGMQFNDINTTAGDVQLKDYRLDLGKLSLTGSQRTVDRNLSDAVLRGMGREDLIALKGATAQEWTALLPLFADSKGVSRFSLTHYTKDETVDKSGNLATATENHTRKDTVALNPFPSTSLQLINEVTDTGNVVRPEGASLDHTVSRTYQLTQKFADNTTTILTRNLTVTDKGGSSDPDVRTETTTLHLDTKPFQQLALVGDWNHIDNSKDGSTADTKLKVTAPINKALSLSADWQDKYTDVSGVEQHLSYTLNYLWHKTKNFALTSKVDRTGQLTALKTTRSQTLSLSPWKDTTFEYTFSDTADPTAPSFAQKLTLRQNLLRALAFVAQQKNSQNPKDGNGEVNTYYFDWTRPKSPYSLQLGFETFDFTLAGDAPSSGQTDPGAKRPALYTKLTANPGKSLSFGGSYVRRRDLTDTSLQLWDWNLSKSFGKQWKLTAKAFCNQPTSDRLDDSVLPFSKSYQKLYEQSYSLDFPMSGMPLLPGHFAGNLAYSLKKDFSANTVSDELGLSLIKNLDATNRLSLKLAHGTGTANGEPGSYNTLTFSYGVHIGEINEISVNCRFTDNVAFTPKEEGSLKGDVTLKRLF